MYLRTPSANSPTTPGSSSLAIGVGGPAEMWCTRNPGSTVMVAGRLSDQARVKTSQTTPVRARAEESSRTYTFMPPPSPVPG
jgi:hypothetical protein